MTKAIASLAFVVAALIVGCNDSSLTVGNGADLAAIDLGAVDLTVVDHAPPTVDQNGCRSDKLKLNGCENDGSVEFCAPDALAPTLQGQVPSLMCAPGGGRAGCNKPGLLLCIYPTTVPRECQTTHGALTAIAMDELCKLAAHDEITEIVPTIVP